MVNTSKRPIDQEINDWKRMSLEYGFYSVIYGLILVLIIFIDTFEIINEAIIIISLASIMVIHVIMILLF